MILGHAIALDLTAEQAAHLRGACGTARYAYNWGSSTQICSSCNATAGPKGRGELNVGEWTCSECGVVNGRDSDAAINLRKLGTAGAEVTRGDMVPLPTRAGVFGKCRS